MRHARDAVMDPVPAATHHGLTNAVNADVAVVVTSNGENRREHMERGNQFTQRGQLGGAVHQVAAQQHHVRGAASHGIQYLPTQPVGTTVPQVNVADIQQPARVRPRRQPLVADMEGVIQPDFEHGAILYSAKDSV